MDFIDLGVVGPGARGAAAGVIEIELPNGARVRFGPPIEVEALRQVLAAAVLDLADQLEAGADDAGAD